MVFSELIRKYSHPVTIVIAAIYCCSKALSNTTQRYYQLDVYTTCHKLADIQTIQDVSLTSCRYIWYISNDLTISKQLRLSWIGTRL